MNIPKLLFITLINAVLFTVLFVPMSAVRKRSTLPQQSRSDTIKKDTVLAIKKDSISTILLQDTLRKPFVGLQRDTTYRPDTLVVKKDSMEIRSEVLIEPLSHLTVCQGVFVNVYFSANGPFNANNRFIVQMADLTGKYTNVSDSAHKSPIKIKVPLDRSGVVQVRVVATSPAIESVPAHFSVLPPAHARIEFTDGSFITKIGPGQMANYRVNLTGAGPWSFMMSDSTVVSNTFVNPYTATIAPPQTKVFRVHSVGNMCGSGSTSGEVIVQVSQDTIPQITLRAVPKGGYQVCTGVPFQVNFAAIGKYELGNGFVVQISDSTGSNFVNSSDMGERTPVVARTPYGLKTGKYKLRVVATFPAFASDTANLTVTATTTTILQKDTLEIPENQPAYLTLHNTGGGPWFVLLSDGTYQNNITKSPYKLKVSPYNSTTYSITSAGGYCGVGDFVGTAVVNVKVPPTSLTTGDLSKQTICAGTDIAVPFTSTGRFFAANKFIVQIADTTGEWSSLPTTGGMGNLRAKITPNLYSDTLANYQIRVISTAPAATGSPSSIKIYRTNAAQAQLTGGATIRSGGATRLRIRFKNGLPPWSFTLTDGTAINGTFINPYQLTVNPKIMTEYHIDSFTSGCGSGTSQGMAVVKVEGN